MGSVLTAIAGERPALGVRGGYPRQDQPGSKNLLGALKVADLWNRRRLGGAFSDAELCAMVTSNPADAMALDDRIGRICAGLRADIFVLARRRDDPSRNLMEATEQQVALVVADGFVRYGKPELVRSARALNVSADQSR